MDCVTYMKLAGIQFIPEYDEEECEVHSREPVFQIIGDYGGLNIYRMEYSDINYKFRYNNAKYRDKDL